MPYRHPGFSVVCRNIYPVITISRRQAVGAIIPKFQSSGRGFKLVGDEPFVLRIDIPVYKCLVRSVEWSHTFIREIHNTIFLPGKFPVVSRYFYLPTIGNDGIPAGGRIILFETFRPGFTTGLLNPGKVCLTGIKTCCLNIQSMRCPNQIIHGNIHDGVRGRMENEIVNCIILLVDINVVFVFIKISFHLSIHSGFKRKIGLKSGNTDFCISNGALLGGIFIQIKSYRMQIWSRCSHKVEHKWRVANVGSGLFRAGNG